MKYFIPTEEGNEMVVMRTRAERRHNNVKKALRKRRISEDVLGHPRETQEIYFGGIGVIKHPYYDNLHQFSKNKIHCSCPMCSAKTNNRKNVCFGSKFNPSISQMRRIEAMDYSEMEYQML